MSQRISGAYQWLGYALIKDFLAAYGYEYGTSKSGRPVSARADDIISKLKRRYPEGTPFRRLNELVIANPDLAAKIKTLCNTAKQKFGMPFSKYLLEQGLLINDKEKILK